MTLPLVLTIGGQQVAFDESTFAMPKKVQERQRFQCTVLDYTGTLVLSYGEQVVLTDANSGVIFSGYLIDDKQNKQNTYPDPLVEHQIDTIDGRWLADKRTTSRQYFTPVNTGKVVVDLWNDTLKAEGLNAYAGLHFDSTQADFATGTLTGTTSTLNVGDGDLELPLAGSTVNFSQGAVSYPTTQAIKITGNQSTPGANNAYTYMEIWSGSYTIASNDNLNYTVWIASTSPEIKAGVDITFTDGSSLQDSFYSGAQDVQSMTTVPSNDLGGLATNTWYTRQFLLGFGSLVGKTIASVTVALAGSKTGTYTAYFRNITMSNGGSTTATFFSTVATSVQTGPIPLRNAGYSNVAVTVVPTYERTGTVTSSAFSLSAAAIAKSSFITWSSTTPANETLTISASLDGGATYQPCTINSAIPGLLPGQNLSGQTLTLTYTFVNNGPDPTIIPTLTSVSGTVSPSYTATKSDIVVTKKTQADWNGGTLTNLAAPASNVLQLNGFARNWDDANFSNQTTWGLGLGGQTINVKTLALYCQASGEDRVRLDFAGQWQNFTAEVDTLVDATITQRGFVYRTTGWQNNNDTYAYTATVNLTQVVLARGTNSSSGAGASTTIATATLNLATGNWHHLKIVVNGSNHKIYLDDVLYINATDATFGAAGYIGLRNYNATGTGATAYFDNFGVVGIAGALSGTWVSPAIDIHSLGTIQGSELIAQIDPNNASVTSVLLEASLNNGSTWATCTNGATVPGLTNGTNVSSMTQVLIRVTISATSASTGPAMPDISALTLLVMGAYSSSGTRTTIPLGNDMVISRTVGSGWGTAFDGQTWAQVGTGTTQVSSNEETIVNTTGDVHMHLGSNTWTDEEGTMRFQLSANTISAGLELRYVDTNNFYRLVAAQNSLSIIMVLRGISYTLATATPALSTGTWYRMRFRVVGSGPINSYGKVWLDGTLEPGVVVGILSTTNPQWNVTATQ